MPRSLIYASDHGTSHQIVNDVLCCPCGISITGPTSKKSVQSSRRGTSGSLAAYTDFILPALNWAFEFATCFS